MKFNDYLRKEYDHRKALNARFSMRSFASKVGLTSSYLSKIMKNERNATVRTIQKVGKNLGLNNEQIRKIVDSERSQRKMRAGNPRFEKLDVRILHSIFDWRNDVVLELLKLKTFEPNVRWVANILSVSEDQAQRYLDNLFQLGLLKVEDSGNWIDSTGGFTTFIVDPRLEKELRRQRQIEILGAAIDAVKHRDLAERDQSAMVMATSSKKLKAAKARIAKFRRELCRFLEDTPEKDVVFQLSVSLFPVTNRGDSQEAHNDSC